MRLLFLVASTLVLSTAAQADELKVKPGEWETSGTAVMNMTMYGQTQTIPVPMSAETYCVTEEESTFKPDVFAGEECSVSDVTQTSSSLDFAISCLANGMQMTGRTSIKLDSSKENATGTVSMKGGMEGVDMNMVGNFQTKYIGACK